MCASLSPVRQASWQLPQSELLRDTALLFDFVAASDWNDALTVLKSHPALLEKLSLVTDFIQAVDEQGDIASFRLLGQTKGFLQQLNGCSLAHLEDLTPPKWWSEDQKTFRNGDLTSVILLARPLIERDEPYLRILSVEHLNMLVDGWSAVLASPSFQRTPLSWRLDAFNTAGNCLMTRARMEKEADDLGPAVKLYQRAAAESPPGWRNSGKYLHNIAMVLSYRYRQYTGAAADLDRALEAQQQALTFEPQSPLFLGQLGGLFVDRFERTGSLSDLEQAISLLDRTRSMSVPTSLDLPIVLGRLASALRNRFELKQESSDIENAVELGRQSVDAASSNPEFLPALLTNFGNSLLDKAHAFNSRDDMTGAVDAFRRSVELSVRTDPLYPARLNNLANGLGACYTVTGDARALEESICRYKEAICLAPETAPQLVSRLYNLANALRQRWQTSSKHQDLLDAAEFYQRACVTGIERDPRWAFFAARNWGAWAADRQSWREASKAYAYGIAALDRLVGVQLSRSGKETWLSQLQSFSSEAAFAFFRAGRLTRAVLALEQGRAHLMTEALQLHSLAAEDLRSGGYGELVSAYESAIANWSSITQRDERQEGHSFVNDDRVTAGRAELDRVICAIRKVPGYKSFALPARIRDVRNAAKLTPLVYLTAARHAGLALIVTASPKTTIRAISLELDSTTLRKKVEYFQNCYLQSDLDPKAWLAALDESTGWLWHACMGPVLNHMKRAPRLALIPCGLLSLLPLHAAWRSVSRSQRRYVIDRLTLAYIPNARSLVASVARTSRGSDKSLLVVADPTPTRRPRLRYAALETMAARSRFATCKLLHQNQATHESVLTLLSEYEAVHIACHAFADVANPLRSGFVLAHDKLLTVQDLLHTRLDLLRLAVLSACETAVPGEKLPDEIVSLSSGFFQAGADAVIASQWSVLDASTLILMARFYHLWRVKKLTAPEALRQSQLWMRLTPDRVKAHNLRNVLPKSIIRELLKSKSGVTVHSHPDHWAAFAYVGP